MLAFPIRGLLQAVLRLPGQLGSLRLSGLGVCHSTLRDGFHDAEVLSPAGKVAACHDHSTQGIRLPQSVSPLIRS